MCWAVHGQNPKSIVSRRFKTGPGAGPNATRGSCDGSSMREHEGSDEFIAMDLLNSMALQRSSRCRFPRVQLCWHMLANDMANAC